MINTKKYELVRKVLSKSEIIREWYDQYHEVGPDDFTRLNVNEYGLGGMGDLADSIISDGLEEGIITQEEITEAEGE